MAEEIRWDKEEILLRLGKLQESSTRDVFRDSYETYADYYNTYAKSVEEIKSALNILYYEKEQERRALSEMVTEMSMEAGGSL